MRLSERTIVVTGASSGLGRSMAEAFVAEGANVVCASRSADTLSPLAEELTAAGPGRAVAVPTDVRSWADVRSLVEATVEEFGGLDTLVNNAGVTQLNVHGEPEYRSVAELPVSAWDAILETNLRGVFLCTKAALGEMLPAESGRIIHVASGHGVSGRANRAAYVASKFGLEGFHETLALELDDTGVDTLTLRPPSGGVYTERKGEYGRPQESFPNEDPSVVAEPSVRLAAGEGENGGRYQATDDGEGIEPYSR
jgi:3-oxoacyl-[acyl-carrier protein] reductase